MNELMQQFLTKLTAYTGEPSTPLQRMATAALKGDAQAFEHAERQYALLQRKFVAAKVYPDELPALWSQHADSVDKHGVRSEVATAIRTCVQELEAALSYAGWTIPSAHQVGLYHTSSVHSGPYHSTIIQYKETADACAKQWRTELSSSNTEIKTVPLFKAAVSARMVPVYQIVSSLNEHDVSWVDVGRDRYNAESDSRNRRIVWQPE